MIFLFAALSMGLLQAVTPPATPPAAPESAPVYGPSHIQEDTLHLSFDLPEGIRSRVDIADKTNETFQKKSSTGERCVSMPAFGFDPVVIRRIYFYRYRGACLMPGISPDLIRHLAASALTGILKSSGKPAMASPLDYDLAGHPAAAISGNVFSEKNHGLLFGEMACASVEGDVVCWAFVSSTAPKASRLAALPVHFGGKAAVPVIPEDLSHLVALPSVTFRDEQRHLEFTYPGTFANAEERANGIIAKKAEDGTEQQKRVLGCMKVLLSADDLEDSDRSNILIYAYPANCSKFKPTPAMLKDFASGIANGMTRTMKADIGKPVLYKLAGQDAVLMRGTLHLPSGKDAQLFVTCSIVSSDLLCWQGTSSSAERLAPLAASTVSLGGGAPAVLIPSDVMISVEVK